MENTPFMRIRYGIDIATFIACLVALVLFVAGMLFKPVIALNAIAWTIAGIAAVNLVIQTLIIIIEHRVSTSIDKSSHE